MVADPKIEDQLNTEGELRFDDGKMRQLAGVQIFTTGEHTDSAGNKRIWTRSQLTDIIKKFNEKIPSSVPIKLGHTSPEHTKSIANALNIPTEVLMGENGRGAARLGSVNALAIQKDGTLIADFQIADGIANLVESAMFNTVSAEIIPDYQGQGPVLSGVALLGADRPALKKLEGLQAATLSSEGGPEPLLYYSDYSMFARSSNTTYTVPITQTDREGGRVVNRTTTVQHVRADSQDGARKMVARIIERTASGFGQIIGQGAGHIVILLAAAAIGKEIQRRYDIGNPFAVPGTTTETTRTTTRHGKEGTITSSNVVEGTVRRRGGPSRYRFEEAETFSAVGVFLGIVGTYSVGKTLYRMIMENRQDGQPGHVDAWAATPPEAQGLAQEKFSDEWKTIRQIALTGTAFALAKEGAKKLFAEDLYYSADINISNLVSRTYKPGRTAVEGELVNSAGKTLGRFFAVLMPDRKRIRIDWIEGNITTAGGRKLISIIKNKYPWAREISGLRISGAKRMNNPPGPLSKPVGGMQYIRWAEGLSEGLYRFHKREDGATAHKLNLSYAAAQENLHDIVDKIKSIPGYIQRVPRATLVKLAVLSWVGAVELALIRQALVGRQQEKKLEVWKKEYPNRFSASLYRSHQREDGKIKGVSMGGPTRRLFADNLYRYHESERKHRHMTIIPPTIKLRGRSKRQANALLKKGGKGRRKDKLVTNLPAGSRARKKGARFMVIQRKRKRFRRDTIRAGVFAEGLYKYHQREDGKKHFHPKSGTDFRRASKAITSDPDVRRAAATEDPKDIAVVRRKRLVKRKRRFRRDQVRSVFSSSVEYHQREDGAEHKHRKRDAAIGGAAGLVGAEVGQSSTVHKAVGRGTKLVKKGLRKVIRGKFPKPVKKIVRKALGFEIADIAKKLSNYHTGK